MTGSTKPARAGDTVRYRPSGETIKVAGLRGDQLVVAHGWDAVAASPEYFDVVKAASDLEHVWAVSENASYPTRAEFAKCECGTCRPAQSPEALVLRLAILVDHGDLPAGWFRVHHRGARHPHAERSWEAAGEPCYTFRRCRAEVQWDGRWSIRGDDGPRQYQVASMPPQDVAAAFADAERTAALWMAQPVGSAWLLVSP